MYSKYAGANLVNASISNREISFAIKRSSAVSVTPGPGRRLTLGLQKGAPRLAARRVKRNTSRQTLHELVFTLASSPQRREPLGEEQSAVYRRRAGFKVCRQRRPPRTVAYSPYFKCVPPSRLLGSSVSIASSSETISHVDDRSLDIVSSGINVSTLRFG